MARDLHTLVDTVHDATTRYLQDVDRLSDEELAAPSVLPDWTRAHVVAHVAFNGLGFARALQGLARGELVPVYASPAARDVDIEKAAAGTPARLRELSLEASTRWRHAAETVVDSGAGGKARLERVPGVAWLTVPQAIEARWREVEIHHADLDAGYGPNDWPEEFVDAVFNRVVADRQDGPSMLLRTPDGDVLLGSGYGTAVTGARADLAWWLLGRGSGEGLSSDEPLPTLGPWPPPTPAT